MATVSPDWVQQINKNQLATRLCVFCLKGVCRIGYNWNGISASAPRCSAGAPQGGLGSLSCSPAERAPAQSYISHGSHFQSHCLLEKCAQFWSNTACTLCPQWFVLAALKWNLFECTPFPGHFGFVPLPDLLWSLITAALVFASLANLDLLPGYWYLYCCLDCNNCLWGSGERRYGISFYWGDGKVDLLLGREINGKTNSKRCVLRQGGMWGKQCIHLGRRCVAF